MSKAARLAIVGDVAMEEADPRVVLDRAAPYLRESGIAFCNCEWPLTDRGAPWPGKAGRVVRSHPSKLETYTFAGFDAVGLANNHTMNYGPEGLLQTIEQGWSAGWCPWRCSILSLAGAAPRAALV